MSELAIDIEGLCKSRKGFELRDVSLKLPRGYVMGLIGPNGSGKTTIIKLLMNLARRDAGNVRILGLDNVENEVEVRSRIGFLYDEPCFHDDCNLEDQRRALCRFYPGWCDSTFDRLADEFGLPRKRKFKKLSRGMKTKFGLVLALSHDADLLVLDEPTSGLDPVFRRELLDCLAQVLQDEGKSVLFSTHVVTDLERIADYVTLIDRGEVAFSLSREELNESWGVIKGDEAVIEAVSSVDRKGLRRGAYGVEILTSNIESARRRLGSSAVVERASLEDIMVLMTGDERHAA
jgi:ABC-2 type transport system ATP-binding protein